MPVSLLFSCDQESSRPLVQAFKELELEIEYCSDIFAAVEWLTSRSFDVIVADCDSGPEAAFLLKNSRELKLNKSAFTLALASGAPSADAQDGPDLALTKPLISDQVKYSVLSNDRFLVCMRAWVARGDFVQRPASTITAAVKAEKLPTQLEQNPATIAAEPVTPSPSRIPAGSRADAPLHLTFATLDRGLFRSIAARISGGQGSGLVKRYTRKRLVGSVLLGLVFVAGGCVYGSPLRVQTVFASVATAYQQAATRLGKPRSHAIDVVSVSSGLTQAATQTPAGHRSRVRVPASQTIFLTDETVVPPPETGQVDASSHQGRPPVESARVLIPESLSRPQPQTSTLQTASLKRSPMLLSQVEPVNVAEDLSQALLLQKVTPNYPQQALKAGIEGAVILQAWIGKDGCIRDLKLVDGSLLLGRAAVEAVKQWRYKPYLRNGVAVEAQTYVTVNFRLP
ncbi:MAG TPA: TonB family protein [Terriglobales bacterium]|jgi:TonB family protein|nr:TonB family protein [Terriglobales bacterium]